MATASLTLAHAATLTWDHDADGTASDGNGAWLGANQWLDGVPSPATWTSGDDAVFGSGGSIGDGVTVTLDSPTTANTLTFNNFTSNRSDRYYGMGSSGQALTLSNGIVMNAGAGPVRLVSPTILGGTQTWLNNTTWTLRSDGGLDYGGNDLTFDGTGNFYLKGTGSNLGDLIMNSSGLANIREMPTPADQLIVNDGVVLISNNLGSGNVALNNGMLTDYYRATTIFPNGLGTGTDQIQIFGDSGFGAGNGGSNWRIGASNSVLQWGSTHFNPTSFRLRAPLGDNNGPSIYGQAYLQNGLDLNGSARTIWVNGGNGPDYKNPIQALGGINAGLSDTAGGGSLVKTGGGTLVFGDVANTYDGGTTVNGGWIRYDRADQMPSTGNHAFNDGSGLWVDIGDSPRFSTASSGAGSLGGLLSGTGPGTSTTSFSGNVDLILEPSGTPDYAGDIPASIRNVTIHNGDMTLSGTNSFTGYLWVGFQEQNARVVTLGSSTAIPTGADVKVDTRGTARLNLNGNSVTIGNLQLGSNNGGQQGTVEDTVGGAVLTLTNGILLDSHNDGGGRVSVDTLDLNNTTQTFTHNGNNRGTPDLIIESAVQNGGLITNATNGQSEIYLNGANTYAGGTTHQAGRLVINGSLADATMDVQGGNVQGSGTLTFNISGASIDQVVTSGGSIDISGMTCEVLGTPTETEYILVDATGGGSYSGTFASSSLPAGYSLDYATANIVKIVGTPGGSPFETWVGTTGSNLGFDEDKNGDGIDNGMAFLLGAANPDVDANDKLPTATENGSGGLVMTFQMLDSASRGTAALSVQHSGDLGATDPWGPLSPAALVPDSGTGVTVEGVDFTVTGTGTLDVTATIPSAGNAIGGKLFGRLLATE
ncbi:beta strand repeat-containing protein [Haloferula sp. A504]|uniref:beta strand repeat-containing protein n=1 Tax=Haloferula sp. A504 TaxID=3373601 RepID=UPI00379A4D20